ncbi:MAG: hypothetical protein ACRD0N_01190 [Acidimicrobiales bacterium]
MGKGGSLLNLGVLADTAQSTIDSLVGPSSGVSRLVPLSLTSEALPVLNGLTANLPTFESRTPGGDPNVSGSAVDFSQSGGNLLGLPLGAVGSLLGGQLIPTSLTSALDAAGARSALDAALANLSVLSGVLKVNSVSNKLGTAASLPDANGTRALAIDAITLLNLGELLKGLNLDLLQLPLGIVSQLLSTLNLPLALPAGATDLASAVDGLLVTVTDILDAVAADNTILSQVVNSVPVVNSLLGGLPVSLPLNGIGLTDLSALNLPLGTVQSLLGTLQTTLQNLLGNALNLLGNLPLLKLDGAIIGATTKASDTLANSAADVTAQLGGLSVLGIQLPGVDLLSIGQTVNTVTGLLGSVLSIIDPSLKDLIKVGVLDKATSLTTANGYNNALAGVSVLSVEINPPALLSNLVSGLTGNTGLSALGKLGAAGVANPAASLPVLGSGIGNLGNLLNLPATVGALTQGLSLKVGSIQSASQFRLASAPAPAAVSAAPAPAPGQTLPRTGADTRTLGILAAGMAMLALGVRRWARRSELD